MSIWKRTTRTAACALATATMAGCAGYSIVRDGDGDGYDVYAPAPYLLMVTSEGQDGKKVTQATVEWLPDYSKRYRISSWNVFGKADFAFEIAHGWQLTSIEDKSDNTSIPEKLLDLVATKAQARSPDQSLGFQLFKIVFDERTGNPVKLLEVKPDPTPKDPAAKSSEAKPAVPSPSQ